MTISDVASVTLFDMYNVDILHDIFCVQFTRTKWLLIELNIWFYC